MELSEENKQALENLKAHFPFRIVFGLFIDGEFCTFADTDKRRMNKFVKSGYVVFLMK